MLGNVVYLLFTDVLSLTCYSVRDVAEDEEWYGNTYYHQGNDGYGHHAVVA